MDVPVKRRTTPSATHRACDVPVPIGINLATELRNPDEMDNIRCKIRRSPAEFLFLSSVRALENGGVNKEGGVVVGREKSLLAFPRNAISNWPFLPNPEENANNCTRNGTTSYRSSGAVLGGMNRSGNDGACVEPTTARTPCRRQTSSREPPASARRCQADARERACAEKNVPNGPDRAPQVHRTPVLKQSYTKS